MSQLELFAELATYVRREIVDRIDKSGDGRLTFLELPLQIELPPLAQIHVRDKTNKNQISVGRSACGTVYKAKWTFPRESGAIDVDVAVKVLKVQNEKALVKDFRREAHMWACIPPHRNVLPLLGIYFRDDDRTRGLVSPFVTSGTLSLEEQRTYRERFKLVRDVAEGLKHLHEKGIVHGDLHPGNIFMVDGCAVLGDFGLSRLEELHAGVGSGIVSELPSDSLQLYFNKETDVKKFGVVASKIMIRGVPDGQLALFNKTLADYGLRELWQQCQVENPEVRPADGTVIVERIGELPAIPDSVN